MLERSVFFVSDGTGITAETFGNSILAQFPTRARHVRRPFVDSEEKADKVVDEMAVTQSTDQATLLDQFTRAMNIWLPELPDIPIQQWYHRIPYNTTNWTGWPTKDNAFVNGAFWHLTFQLILNQLQAAA